MTQVQVEMSETLSQRRLHQSITPTEREAGTCSVAEYAINIKGLLTQYHPVKAKPDCG